MNNLFLFLVIVLLSVGFGNRVEATTCLEPLEPVLDNLGEEKFFLDKIKIEEIFSKDESYEKYRGVEGQLLFNESSDKFRQNELCFSACLQTVGESKV